MRRLLAVLLLPLSLVPVALAIPHVAEQRDEFRARYLERDPLAVPATGPLPAAGVPEYRDRIPVLVYHGISDEESPWTHTQATFARHMAALDAAGFHTVSAATYARFARGERVALPSRPILVTFDDGRLDSFRGADAVLAEHGMRATMFAISDVVRDHSSIYLDAEELQGMADSGRWDVQFHAGEGHTQVTDASGRERPFYAATLPGEDLREYTARVTGDLVDGRAELGELVPQAGRELFAVPYSDYGQAPGGDPARAQVMRRVLTSRFAVTFVQRSSLEPTRRGQTGVRSRFEPRPDTTAEDLLRVLRNGLKDKEA